MKRRTDDPYRRCWSVVWGAPTPCNSGGRSAVSTTSGTSACDASITAGWKFAVAVPDVHNSKVGTPVTFAMPSAANAALRSS